MNKYAIVLPTSYCFGTVVALLVTDQRPTVLKPYIAVKLRGLYKCELGDECPFEMALGGHQEMIVDTSGT